MADEYTILKIRKKAVAILTIIFSALTLFSVTLQFVLPLYWQSQLSTGKQAYSVGIIGGADGPTVIFISSSPSFAWITLVLALLSVCGILYLIFSKKK